MIKYTLSFSLSILFLVGSLNANLIDGHVLDHFVFFVATRLFSLGSSNVDWPEDDGRPKNFQDLLENAEKNNPGINFRADDVQYEKSSTSENDWAFRCQGKTLTISYPDKFYYSDWDTIALIRAMGHADSMRKGHLAFNSLRKKRISQAGTYGIMASTVFYSWRRCLTLKKPSSLAGVLIALAMHEPVNNFLHAGIDVCAYSRAEYLANMFAVRNLKKSQYTHRRIEKFQDWLLWGPTSHFM